MFLFQNFCVENRYYLIITVFKKKLTVDTVYCKIMKIIFPLDSSSALESERNRWLSVNQIVV